MGCANSKDNENDKQPEKQSQKQFQSQDIQQSQNQPQQQNVQNIQNKPNEILDRVDINELNYEAKMDEDRKACIKALEKLQAEHEEQENQSKREFYAMEQQAQIYKYKMESFKQDINEQGHTELFAQYGYKPPTLEQLNNVYDNFDADVTAIFQKYDKDCSGKLSPQEFMEAIPELFESLNLPRPNQSLVDGLILTYSKKGSHNMKIKKFIRACEDLTGMRNPDKIKGREIVDTMIDNRKYLGQINSNRQPHGYGRIVKEEKDSIFEGQFYKGEYHGFGIAHYISTGKLKYEGQFKKGEANGWGKYYFSDGDIYQGQLKSNELCGFGKRYQKCNDIYIEGQFKGGFANGFIILKNVENKILFKGTMRNNKRYDYGIRCIEDFEYTGQFQGDKAYGYGRTVKDDGTVYEGYYRDGDRYGYGILFDPSKPDGEKTTHGYWDNNTLQKIIKQF